jgi:N-acetylglucosamine kinase-like BadF-type ATPase
VFEAYDGILSKTELTARVLQRFEVEEPPQLIPFIYGQEDSRTKIASLCKDVFELFRAGEPHAIEVIERAGYDISCSIQNLIHNAFPEQQDINVVLTGSVFKSWDIMMPMLKKHLPVHVELIKPMSPPISGSIIESYQAVNGPCPTAFTDRLHRSLSEVEGT